MRKFWEIHKGDIGLALIAILLATLLHLALRPIWKLPWMFVGFLVVLGWAVMMFLLLDKFCFWWARAKFDLYVFHGSYDGSQVTYTRVGGRNCIVPQGQELVIRNTQGGTVEIVMHDTEPELPDDNEQKL